MGFSRLNSDPRDNIFTCLNELKKELDPQKKYICDVNSLSISVCLIVFILDAKSEIGAQM